jgi:hypothetical protein
LATSELTSADLPELAVAWLPVGTSELGEETVAAPIEIASRWEEGYRRSGGSDKSDKHRVSHRVFVADNLPLNTILWQGALAEAEATPSSVTPLYKVIEASEIKDLRGLVATRYVLLTRHPNKLNLHAQ